MGCRKQVKLCERDGSIMYEKSLPSIVVDNDRSAGGLTGAHPGFGESRNKEILF